MARAHDHISEAELQSQRAAGCMERMTNSQRGRLLDISFDYLLTLKPSITFKHSHACFNIGRGIVKSEIGIGNGSPSRCATTQLPQIVHGVFSFHGNEVE
jgi:hypothetical protein